MDFDRVVELLKTNYVPLVSIAAVGIGFMMLRRYSAGGKCYSDATLNGKVVIVTGANTGIGKETALDLAKRGAKVILACRDLAKGEDAAQEIRTKTGNQNVVFKLLDLASLASIRAFADSIIKSEQHLDILINNAGLFVSDRYETSDGFELTFGTNHLGPFLLTNLLLDLLKKSAPSRIVNVSSTAHAGAKINFDDVNATKRFSTHVAYGQSKLANVLFTKELARRLKGTGVTCYSLHPGFVSTEVFRDLAIWARPILYVFLILISKNCKDGAQTSIHCAVEESLANESGYYYSDCKQKKPSAEALNVEDAKRLWKVSADLVKLDTKKD